MPSNEIIEFTDSVNYLKQHYLPNARASSALPSDHDQELARAYCVFFHAELEHYFEKVAEKIIEDTKQNLSRGVVTYPTLSIIAFSGQTFNKSGDALTGDKYRKLSTVVIKIIDELKKAIENNHGTSEKYISKLFIPLGISSNTIDPAWLAEINSLASERGLFAHKSIARSSRPPAAINPLDVLQKTDRIINGSSPQFPGIFSLEKFDEWYLNILSHQPTYNLNYSSFYMYLNKFKSIFEIFRSRIRRQINT